MIPINENKREKKRSRRIAVPQNKVESKVNNSVKLKK